MEPNFKNLSDFLFELDSIYRFPRNDLMRPETVLKHSGITALISLYLLDTINQNRGGLIFTAVDYAGCLMDSLIHDIDEIGTGDIARPTKYATPSLLGLFKTLAEESLDKVVEEFSLPHAWIHNWKGAKKGVTGLIVEVADMTSAALVAYREYRVLSNNQFKKVTGEIRNNLIALHLKLYNDTVDIASDDLPLNKEDTLFILNSLCGFITSTIKFLEE
jgi:5'-deoxynucleotidase YfbR-like HD superfamily hydrolase